MNNIAEAELHSQSLFQGTDGISLFWRRWLPDNASDAVVVFIHGIGDHCSRHGSLVSALVRSGYAVYAYDSRGNGRSPGQRGHIDSWDQLRGDLAAFMQLVRELEPGAPIFLLGFSMGSLVVLDFVLHGAEGIEGVIIISAPMGETGVPPVLMKLATVLNRVTPRFSMEMRLDKTHISREPEVVRAQATDHFCHGRGTARMGAEYIRCVSRIHSRAGALKVPLLVLHGEENTIADPKGSRNFYSNVMFADKQYYLYKGGYHELDDDACKNQVLEDISMWLKDHTQSSQEKTRCHKDRPPLSRYASA